MSFLDGKYTPVILVAHHELRKLLSEVGSDRTVAMIETWQKELREISGYKWGGSFVRLTATFGMEFKVIFSQHGGENSGWFCSIWTMNELTIVRLVDLPKDRSEVNEFITKILYAMDRWAEGYIKCSSCGTLHEYKVIKSNRYFAGTYCQTCWEREFKAIEAKENYD